MTPSTPPADALASKLAAYCAKIMPIGMLLTTAGYDSQALILVGPGSDDQAGSSSFLAAKRVLLRGGYRSRASRGTLGHSEAHVSGAEQRWTPSFRGDFAQRETLRLRLRQKMVAVGTKVEPVV
ncbi:hypothetical protein SEPCBS119000_005214 [Sporothrix epigloea]|uniref:Uncharacterized protein n=1 Tax=Sporothrix epigloea TaxID=1892477 RepID=A0ABP0E0B1_9PEZI